MPCRSTKAECDVPALTLTMLLGGVAGVVGEEEAEVEEAEEEDKKAGGRGVNDGVVSSSNAQVYNSEAPAAIGEFEGDEKMAFDLVFPLLSLLELLLLLLLSPLFFVLSFVRPVFFALRYALLGLSFDGLVLLRFALFLLPLLLLLRLLLSTERSDAAEEEEEEEEGG